MVHSCSLSKSGTYTIHIRTWGQKKESHYSILTEFKIQVSSFENSGSWIPEACWISFPELEYAPQKIHLRLKPWNLFNFVHPFKTTINPRRLIWDRDKVFILSVWDPMKKHHQFRTGLLTNYQGCLVCPWFSFWCVIFVRRLKTYNIFPVCLTTWVIYPFVNCNFWGDWKRKVTRSFLELQSLVWSRSWRFCIPIARKKSSSAESSEVDFIQPRFL